MAGADLNLLRESLDLLILKALLWGPRHGYAVSEWIGQATEAALFVDEGTLYPALHRLAARGWVEGEWGVSGGRRARYYQLTPAGRAHLQGRVPAWLGYANSIANALRSTDPDPGLLT